MSFTWTSVTQSVTKVLPSHLNEIKTATDTLSGKLSIGNYSWSRFPISQNAKISYSDINELRSGLNYVHDNNVCTAHNSDKDATINTTQRVTYNSNVETADNASNHQNYNATQYTSNNGAPQYTSNNASPNYSSNNATQHQSYNATQYTSNNASPQYSNNCNTQNSSVRNAPNNTAVK